MMGNEKFGEEENRDPKQCYGTGMYGCQWTGFIGVY